MNENIQRAQDGDHVCSASNGCQNRVPVAGMCCIMHGGKSQVLKLQKESIYGRLSAQYKERIKSMTDHTGHFSLNEEVGVLRIMLENLLENIQDSPNKMLRATGQVAELVTRIEKLVTSAMKAEKYIGGLMSREQANAMLQEAVDIIAEEITDVDTLTRIAERLTEIANKEYKDE